jgi:hypothetical protein
MRADKNLDRTTATALTNLFRTVDEQRVGADRTARRCWPHPTPTTARTCSGTLATAGRAVFPTPLPVGAFLCTPNPRHSPRRDKITFTGRCPHTPPARPSQPGIPGGQCRDPRLRQAAGGAYAAGRRRGPAGPPVGRTADAGRDGRPGRPRRHVHRPHPIGAELGPLPPEAPLPGRERQGGPRRAGRVGPGPARRYANPLFGRA